MQKRNLLAMNEADQKFKKKLESVLKLTKMPFSPQLTFDIVKHNIRNKTTFIVSKSQ